MEICVHAIRKAGLSWSLITPKCFHCWKWVKKKKGKENKLLNIDKNMKVSLYSRVGRGGKGYHRCCGWGSEWTKEDAKVLSCILQPILCEFCPKHFWVELRPACAAAASLFPRERRKGVRRVALLTGDLFRLLLKVLSPWGAGQALNSLGRARCVCVCDKCRCQHRILMRILGSCTAISSPPVYPGKPGLVVVLISPPVADGWQGRSAALWWNLECIHVFYIVFVI